MLLQQHLYSNVNSVSNLNPIKIRRKLVWPYEILFRMFDADDIQFCVMIWTYVRYVVMSLDEEDVY